MDSPTLPPFDPQYQIVPVGYVGRGPIYDAALSPDGTRIAVTGPAGTTVYQAEDFSLIWESEQGANTVSWRGDTSALYLSKLNATGLTLSTLAADTGDQSATLTLSASLSEGIVSPDGTKVLVNVRQDSTGALSSWQMIDLATKEALIADLHGPSMASGLPINTLFMPVSIETCF